MRFVNKQVQELLTSKTALIVETGGECIGGERWMVGRRERGN